MKRFYENKTFAYIAIAIVIINLVLTFVVIVPSLAVSNEGFCFWTEVTPPNNVLFNGTSTGVISNSNNYDIYLCCGKVGNAYGPLIMSKVMPIGAQIKGMTGSWTVESGGLHTVVYNGNTYYCALINGSFSTVNNFSNAEFSENGVSWTPLNQTAFDFIDYVENNGGGTESQTGSINYALPPGNIAIITTTASYKNLKLTTTMPLQSTVFSENPWPNTTQRIGTYNSLPQSLNPSTLGSVIEWQKTGDTTLFGNTHSAIYEPNIVSKFTYVVISNPYYYPANNMEDSQFTNGAINIVMDDVVNIEVRNLTASVNTSTGEIENTPNGTTWTGEVDEDTGDIVWTDNNGDTTNPNGGANLSDPTITGFQSWLKGILTSIRDIFEPAHDAIQTLSNSVSNFASWMYALYIWLPSPILNLLTSAISLAIVIGVIKVFI